MLCVILGETFKMISNPLEIFKNIEDLEGKNEKDYVSEYYTTELTIDKNYNSETNSSKKLMAIHTQIDFQVGKAFKRYVTGRHGKLKGTIGKVLEDAIIQYLDSQGNQQQTTNYTILKKSSLRRDVHGNLVHIKRELQQSTQFPHFSAVMLKQVVKKVIGFRDPRTEKKYLDIVAKTSEEKPNTLGRLIFDVSKFCESIKDDED